MDRLQFLCLLSLLLTHTQGLTARAPPSVAHPPSSPSTPSKQAGSLEKPFLISKALYSPMGVQDDVWFFWRDLGVVIGWICGLLYMGCFASGMSRTQYWLWLFLLLAADLVWELEVLAILIWWVLSCFNKDPFRPKDPSAPIPTQDPEPSPTAAPPPTAAPNATVSVAAVTIDVSSLPILANRAGLMRKNI
jgi:hypothetical protein